MSKTNRPKKQPTGDYPIGFCRPPKAYRFPKGKSGNPYGTRGSKTRRILDEIIREQLNKVITLTQDGRQERVTQAEAIVRRQINDLLTGTPAQRHRAFTRFLELGWFNPKADDYRLDDEAVRNFVETLAAEPDFEWKSKP